LNDAIGLFNKMTSENINPNVYTFNILVDAFCKEGKVKEAKMKLYPNVQVNVSIVFIVCIYTLEA